MGVNDPLDLFHHSFPVDALAIFITFTGACKTVARLAIMLSIHSVDTQQPRKQTKTPFDFLLFGVK